MYDPWGIGEAVAMSLRGFSHGKRATGRSTLLAQAVQNGDTVVFAQRVEAQRMERIFKQAGKDRVRIVVKDPSQGIGEAFSFIESKYDRRGFLHFDHSWFEALYYYEIRGIMTDVGAFYTTMDNQRSRTDAEKRLIADDQRVNGVWPSYIVDTVEAMGGDVD